MSFASNSAARINALSVADAAREYTRSGLRVVPVPFQQKECFLDDWPNVNLDEVDLPKFFPANIPVNVGLKNGRYSGNIVDVDLDTPEATIAANHFLPYTPWVSGRETNPRSHRWFVSPEPPPTAQFRDTDGKMLVELRSTGSQTVCPPSTHETGELYFWHELKGEPTTLEGNELSRRVVRIAAAAIIARHWPGTGSRHDASKALAGGLLRMGWSVDDAEAFILAVADAAGDEEGRKRAKNAVSTAKRLLGGGPATGWPTLAKILLRDGDKVVALVREWLGDRTKFTPSGQQSNEQEKWPDPISLSEAPAVPEFPVHVFPAKLAEYAQKLAWALNAPVDFVGVTALGLGAGMVGNSRRLRVSSTHQQPSLIYAANVGDPGSGKSPVLKFMTAPLDDIQAAWNAEYSDAMEKWREVEDIEGKSKPPKPHLKVLIARNATAEAVALALNNNPRGIVLPFDELASLFAGMNQYKNGAGNDRQFYLSAWAQETVNILRKSDLRDGIPPLFVVNPCFSIIGGIQPDLLVAVRGQSGRRGMPAPNDGGLDRFLISWPETLPEIGDEGRELSQNVLAVWPSVVKKLVMDRGDKLEPGIVELSVAARTAWVELTRAHAAEVNHPEFPYHLRGPWAKLKAYAARLTLVLHMLRWACGEVDDVGTVAEDTVIRAAELIQYFKAHCRKAHVCMDLDPRLSLGKRVVKWIKEAKKPQFTRRDAYQALKGTVKTVANLDPVLKLLEDHHIIRPLTSSGRREPGRPSAVYEVNPALFGDTGDTGDQFDSGDSPFAAPPDSQPYAHNPQYPQNSGVDTEPAIHFGDTGDTGDQFDSGDSPFAAPPDSQPYAHNPQYPQNSGVDTEPAIHIGDGSIGEMPSEVASNMGHCLIVDAGGLEAVAAGLADAEGEQVYLDVETTGLDAATDRIRLLTLSVPGIDGRVIYLIDCFKVDPTILWPALAACELVGHNLSFDVAFLARMGFQAGKVRDTMLLSQILHASAHTKGLAPTKHGLKDCVAREVGTTLDKELQRSDWSGRLTAEQLAYAADDVRMLGPLDAALTGKLATAGLERTAEIECRAVPCIVWMAGAGVAFDRSCWEALASNAIADADRVARQLEAAAPAKVEGLFGGRWNWDSTDEMKELLALVGCPVESTADQILAKLDHPVAALLRDYRDARKRVTTYGTDWMKHVAPDGRVYPHWSQLGANSGRMSCGSPNMQNLPRGEYRKCFVAPAGRVLVKADYSQIELRIAAKVSGDKALLAAYKRGEDLHTVTAKQVLGIAEVTKQHRQLAKALNFGLLYGMGASGFRAYARTTYGVELTEAEAESYRNAFFKAYPGLKRWHRSVKNGLLDTRTLTGRRVLRVERFNEKLNLPIQGSGADGLKIALALLWERRAECPDAIPIMAIHDEIVIECDDAKTTKTTEWLKRCMVDAIAPLIDPVPVEVEVKAARTWGGD